MWDSAHIHLSDFWGITILIVTPQTQSMSSTRDNRHTPIRRALQVCQALLTDSNNNQQVQMN
jgi:hypothetical protein